MGMQKLGQAAHWTSQFLQEFPAPATQEGQQFLAQVRADQNGVHLPQVRLPPRRHGAAAGDEQLAIQQTPPLPSTPHNEPGSQPKAVDDPSAQGEAERTGVVEANAPADIPGIIFNNFFQSIIFFFSDDGRTKRRLNRDMQQQASEREQHQAKRTRFTNAQLQGQLDYMVGFFNKAKEKVERKNQVKIFL